MARPGTAPQAISGVSRREVTERHLDCSACPSHCCKNDLIVLHPECGDVVALYEEREAVIHPLFGTTVWALKHKPNGDCIYLGDAGCTIHGRHPAICREYDCGDQYAKMPRADRRRLIAQGLFSRAQLEQGRLVHRARLSVSRAPQVPGDKSRNPA